MNCEKNRLMAMLALDEPMDAAERQALTAHARTCPTCAAELAFAQNLRRRTRDQTGTVPSPDLTDRIMAAVEAERLREKTGSLTLRRWLPRMAALFALLLGGGILLATRQSSDPATVARAWLADRQEADGTWSPAAGGGNNAYRPALTALAALALDVDSDRYAPEIARACARLAAQQQVDGAFGGDDPQVRAYNHALAGFALASLYATGRHPELEPQVRRIVDYVLRTQTSAGGWQYDGQSDGNTALSAWNIRLLAKLHPLGWKVCDVPLRRGLRWIDRTRNTDGTFGYEGGDAESSPALTAMATCALQSAPSSWQDAAAKAAEGVHALMPHQAELGEDYYRRYFAIRAFDQGGEKHAARRLRDELARLREQRGDAKGVWNPDARWGGVGGQLYATSFALLGLDRR